MNIDLSEFKKENKIKKQKVKKTGFGTIMPGVFIFSMFILPTYLFFYLFSSSLIPFLFENNLVLLNIVIYLFILFVFIVAIILEVKQPFNAVSNRQAKEGRELRGCAQLAIYGYLMLFLFAIWIIFFSGFDYSKISIQAGLFKYFFWFIY